MAGNFGLAPARMEVPAPSQGIVNMRVKEAQRLGGWRLREFARVNNLPDRQ